MIINQENLSRLYTAFSAVFNAAFQEAQVWYDKVAMTVNANTRIMDYRFILDFPGMKQWIAERQIQSLGANKYLVETLDWEATVEVDRNDIEDDQLGLYNPIVAALGQEAKQHPNQLIALDLLKKAWDEDCYDGSKFFAADHPVGDGVASNTGGGASTPWFLLDTSRAIKPFIFQLRRAVQLVRMDRPDDEEAFMRKKFRYGVDYRAAAAFGLWQLAYGSKVALDSTSYAAARAAMGSLKNAAGRPLGIRPNLLVVPPSLETTARTILKAGIIFEAGSGGKGGAGVTNVWEGTADLLVVPELA
jgi:phage major head subunit gpT-like protein